MRLNDKWRLTLNDRLVVCLSFSPELSFLMGAKGI